MSLKYRLKNSNKIHFIKWPKKIQNNKPIQIKPLLQSISNPLPNRQEDVILLVSDWDTLILHINILYAEFHVIRVDIVDK